MKTVVIKSIFKVSAFYIVLAINGLALFVAIQKNISIEGSLAAIVVVNLFAYLMYFLCFHEFSYDDSKLIVTNAIYPLVHDELFFKDLDSVKLELGRAGYKITVYSDIHLKSYVFQGIAINDVENMIIEINHAIQKIKNTKK